MTPNSGIKNKHPEEEEDADADKKEVKRLKKEEVETESEEKQSSCHQGSESLSDTLESSADTCGQEYSGTSCDTSAISEDHGECELSIN